MLLSTDCLEKTPFKFLHGIGRWKLEAGWYIRSVCTLRPWWDIGAVCFGNPRRQVLRGEGVVAFVILGDLSQTIVAV